MAELPFDLVAFLDEPLRPASVATVGERGGPALGSLWYIFEERRFWFTSRDGQAPFLLAARAGRDVAVMVETFEPPEQIQLLRATGPARIEPRDAARIEKVYRRYLGHDFDECPDVFRARLHDREFFLWTVLAQRGLVVTFPNFLPREFRWSEPGPFLDRPLAKN